MKLNFGCVTIRKCLGKISVKNNRISPKKKYGIVLEYFRLLQKKRRIDQVRREEKLKVKGKTVSSWVIRQVSGSEQLKLTAERWVFKPLLHVVR